jgi:hypothetical protein
MRHSAALAASLACLVSCGPAPKQESAQTAPRETPVQPLKLAGQWQVDLLGGKPLEAGAHPILLTVAGDKIHANSQCIWWYWSHRIDGKQFSAKPTRRESLDENGQSIPLAMCARSLHRQEITFQTAVETANQVEALSPDRIKISTPDNKGENALELVRRPGIEGSWQVVAINGRPLAKSDYPINVGINGSEIMAQSQCVSMHWAYTRNATSLATRQVTKEAAICERSRTETETLFERIMDQARMWRTLTDQGLHIQTGNETLTLKPKA